MWLKSVVSVDGACRIRSELCIRSFWNSPCLWCLLLPQLVGYAAFIMCAHIRRSKREWAVGQ